ncbi:MAG: hypothetical protein K6E93_06505 [Bacteroidales bacterium]|nr:hypothetical protein [Bacteroidales bacterium]
MRRKSEGGAKEERRKSEGRHKEDNRGAVESFMGAERVHGCAATGVGQKKQQEKSGGNKQFSID